MTQILEFMHLSMSSEGIKCEGFPWKDAFLGAIILAELCRAALVYLIDILQIYQS